jgi:hypothetical protein
MYEQMFRCVSAETRTEPARYGAAAVTEQLGDIAGDPSLR